MVPYEVDSVARSLYQLMNKVNGPLPKPPPWEHLSLNEQASWLRLAKIAPSLLEQLEGEKIGDAARAVYLEITAGSDPEARSVAQEIYDERMPPIFRLRWEIITRHLFTILDCDELRSLDESEDLWVDWYRHRLVEHDPEFVPVKE